MKEALEKIKSTFAKVCMATETQARISLLVASAIVVTSFGSVCAICVASKNSDNTVASSESTPNTTATTVSAEEFLNLISESETSQSFQDTRVEYLMGNKEGDFAKESVEDKKQDASKMKSEEVVAMVNSGKKIKTIKKENIKVGDSSTGEKAPTSNNKTAADNKVSAPVVVATPKPEVTIKSNFIAGIDVYGGEGNLDWKKISDFGVKFAFIRIAWRGNSKGYLYADSNYAKNIREAQANGIKVGVYVYSQAIDPKEALEEASYVLELLKGYSLQYPVVIDWETEGDMRTKNVKGENLYNILNTFCKTISQNGYTPMVYMNKSDWLSRLGGSYASSIASSYKVWLALYYSQYDNKTNTFYLAGGARPNFPYHIDVWQYGRVKGVPGLRGQYCDMNVSFDSTIQLVSPSITFDNSTYTTKVGKSIDLTNGMHAVNSTKHHIEYAVSYSLKDSNGNSISLENAVKTIGTYTITYEYVDLYYGVITEKAKLVVNETGVGPTPTPGESKETQATEPTSDTSKETEPTEAAEPSKTTTETTAEPTATPKPTAEPTATPKPTEKPAETEAPADA